MQNFIVNFNLVLYTSQINPLLACVNQNTERSHLVAIVNNSNYSEAKGHSSFVSDWHFIGFTVPNTPDRVTFLVQK